MHTCQDLSGNGDPCLCVSVVAQYGPYVLQLRVPRGNCCHWGERGPALAAAIQEQAIQNSFPFLTVTGSGYLLRELPEPDVCIEELSMDFLPLSLSGSCLNPCMLQLQHPVQGISQLSYAW